MSEIERAAEQSVARGVGFGGLAIALVVAGLAGYPALALKSGAGLCLLMWAVLRLKALWAPYRPYKRTETWLLLEPRPDLPPEQAQQLIGSALKATFERYAQFVLLAAIGLWLGSLVLPASA